MRHPVYEYIEEDREINIAKQGQPWCDQWSSMVNLGARVVVSMINLQFYTYPTSRRLVINFYFMQSQVSSNSIMGCVQISWVTVTIATE